MRKVLNIKSIDYLSEEVRKGIRKSRKVGSPLSICSPSNSSFLSVSRRIGGDLLVLVSTLAMNTARTGVVFIQSVALWNLFRGHSAGIFFGSVYGIYVLHQRIFMIDNYNIRTFSIAFPLLMLHLEFWKSIGAIGSKAFDLGIHGRLIGD